MSSTTPSILLITKLLFGKSEGDVTEEEEEPDEEREELLLLLLLRWCCCNGEGEGEEGERRGERWQQLGQVALMAGLKGR